MGLATGTKLGSYEVVAPIGAGGNAPSLERVWLLVPRFRIQAPDVACDRTAWVQGWGAGAAQSDSKGDPTTLPTPDSLHPFPPPSWTDRSDCR